MSRALFAFLYLPVACVLAAPPLAFAAATDARSASDLAALSIEDLLNVEVTLASKKPQKRLEVADAIYVISNDDIRRSGVTTIPDALRLAPGVQVSRIDANKWAIGIRGFASRLARSVLVLIDGRSVYTPLFAGTYWEVQDVVLEDVDRIEVIRGAGGTLWGQNAFNGVINIITKNAHDTLGGLASAGGGNQEHAFATLRYGGAVRDTAYRVYAKAFRRGGFGGAGKQYDDWGMGHGGFRIDHEPAGADKYMLQGDLYYGVAGSRGSVISYTPPSPVSRDQAADLAGGDLLGRWTHGFSPTSELALQMYYDATYRDELNFRAQRHTCDIDFNHRFATFWRQTLVWGLGYRVTTDTTATHSAIEFIPHDRTDNLFSWYFQDEIAILNNLRFTGGAKFERNDYSGFEFEPSARLLWMPVAGHSLWAAVSNAARTPSRIEHDVEFTVGPAMGVFPRIVGQDSFSAEKTNSYQGGYRFSPIKEVFADLVGFYQHFDDLLSVEPGTPFQETDPLPPHVIFPLLIANKLHGEVYGVEIATETAITEIWHLNVFYAYLQMELSRDPGGHDIVSEVEERSAPHHTAGFQSKIDLPWQLQVDSVFRYVDVLPTQHISSHFNFDARLAKQIGGLEIALIGQNLLAEQHREFGGGTEVERGVYGKLTWQW